MQDQKGFSDRELLEELQHRQGDDAIRFLYRSCYATAEKYIVQNSGSAEDARDIFQEVILSFIELVKQGRFRGECSISTFMYTLTRHTWLNELKRKGRARQREEVYDKAMDTTVIDMNQVMESRESGRQLMRLVEQLGDTCKKILVAFYYENKTMKEILRVLNYENEQVVRNKKYKCLKQLEQAVHSDQRLVSQLKSAFWI